jgi:3D (Asp-Asp-Asp) domain-containing protein
VLSVRIRHACVRLGRQVALACLIAIGPFSVPVDRVRVDAAVPQTAGARVTDEGHGWAWVEQRPMREGVEARTVHVWFSDGRLVARDPLAWTVVRKPVPRIVGVGTRPPIGAPDALLDKDSMILEATAYYPGPRNYGGGVGIRTATGMLAQRGVVAVDPAVIPLGTRVYVEGYGGAIAADTGGAIRGKRIDLCFNTYEEAIRFGRRPVRVYIFGRL